MEVKPHCRVENLLGIQCSQVNILDIMALLFLFISIKYVHFQWCVSFLMGILFLALWRLYQQTKLSWM